VQFSKGRQKEMKNNQQLEQNEQQYSIKAELTNNHKELKIKP
jgi:hypothetical protein